MLLDAEKLGSSIAGAPKAGHNGAIPPPPTISLATDAERSIDLSIADMSGNGDEPPPFKPLGKGRFVGKQSSVFWAGNAQV